eukprot:Gregarina_sp_Poly_1__2199@NODE_1585_length_3778_cov_16_119914_g1046_i0_p1_GENE_NODE_1585_length_3778_cov_16_119914_g1046_i0NODE_1585_length_3778_cov_16_119914_g1046_i0_p1_ORF_typecomplete_len815_score63_14_NODE_1585_length_3778_cov_16_119914_g1046_i0902534
MVTQSPRSLLYSNLSNSGHSFCVSRSGISESTDSSTATHSSTVTPRHSQRRILQPTQQWLHSVLDGQSTKRIFLNENCRRSRQRFNGRLPNSLRWGYTSSQDGSEDETACSDSSFTSADSWESQYRRSFALEQSDEHIAWRKSLQFIFLPKEIADALMAARRGNSQSLRLSIKKTKSPHSLPRSNLSGGEHCVSLSRPSISESTDSSPVTHRHSRRRILRPTQQLERRSKKKLALNERIRPPSTRTSLNNDLMQESPILDGFSQNRHCHPQNVPQCESNLDSRQIVTNRPSEESSASLQYSKDKQKFEASTTNLWESRDSWQQRSIGICNGNKLSLSSWASILQPGVIALRLLDCQRVTSLLSKFSCVATGTSVWSGLGLMALTLMPTLNADLNPLLDLQAALLNREQEPASLPKMAGFMYVSAVIEVLRFREVFETATTYRTVPYQRHPEESTSLNARLLHLTSLETSNYGTPYLDQKPNCVTGQLSVASVKVFLTDLDITSKYALLTPGTPVRIESKYRGHALVRAFVIQSRMAGDFLLVSLLFLGESNLLNRVCLTLQSRLKSDEPSKAYDRIQSDSRLHILNWSQRNISSVMSSVSLYRIISRLCWRLKHSDVKLSDVDFWSTFLSLLPGQSLPCLLGSWPSIFGDRSAAPISVRNPHKYIDEFICGFRFLRKRTETSLGNAVLNSSFEEHKNAVHIGGSMLPFLLKDVALTRFQGLLENISPKNFATTFDLELVNIEYCQNLLSRIYSNLRDDLITLMSACGGIRMASKSGTKSQNQKFRGWTIYAQTTVLEPVIPAVRIYVPGAVETI